MSVCRNAKTSRKSTSTYAKINLASYVLIVHRIYYNSLSFTRYTSDMKDDPGRHDTDISKIRLPRLAKKPSGIARIGIALLLCEITINPTQVNLTV